MQALVNFGHQTREIWLLNYIKSFKYGTSLDLYETHRNLVDQE